MRQIKAITGTTKQNFPVAALVTGPEPSIIAKMYPNEEGTKIRIVIPSLISFKQSRIDVDSHYIEVEL